MSEVSSWSVTDASNNLTPPDGWPEGMQPSGVNDCGRMMMGAIKRWYDTVTAGIANALPLSGGTLTGPLQVPSLHSTSVINADGNISTATDISCRTLVASSNVQASGAVQAGYITSGGSIDAANAVNAANAVTAPTIRASSQLSSDGNLSVTGNANVGGNLAVQTIVAEKRIGSIALSPEGRFLIASRADGTIYVYRLAARGEVFQAAQ